MPKPSRRTPSVPHQKARKAIAPVRDFESPRRIAGAPRAVRQTLQEPSANGNAVGARDYVVLLALLVACTMAVFHDFLLLNKTYLFKDIGSGSINAVHPHLVLLIAYLRESGIPFWSFRQGMGQNVFAPGGLASSVGDPF